MSECLWPHLDRLGETAATKGTTGTVDLAEEDHDVVWVRSCRLQASHDRGKIASASCLP